MFRIALLALCLAASPLAAGDGPAGKVKAAVDPDCTPAKAAKGAAMKATVGVGNRCDAAETARDAAGVDGAAADKPKAAAAVKKATE